jgi:hypothetical protein
MSVMVRRKPGVSIAAANADLTQAFIKSYQAHLVEQPKNTPLALTKVAREHRFDPRRSRAECVERSEGGDVGRWRLGDRAAHCMCQRCESAARPRAPPSTRNCACASR